jgi:hypothetical protein
MTLGLAVGVALAVVIACSNGTPASPATTPAASTTVVSVDTFVGQYTAEPPTAVGDTDPSTTNSCAFIEFHVARDPDSRTAKIVFAATCARVRLRGEGKGTLSGDTLFWKAEGTALLPSARTCAFRFVEGNKATPAGDGLIKVTYNGKVCDTPVSGTALVRRR